MEKEFSLEDEEPLQLACDENLFDVEQELKDPTRQRSREVRSRIAEWGERNQVFKQELEQLRKTQKRQSTDLFVSFAKEYFELQKTIKQIQNRGLDSQLSGTFNRLVDIQIRLEEIFRENSVEVEEDATGQPVDRENHNIRGSVKIEGFGSGSVVETYSPVVRYAGKVVHRAEVMVSR